MEKTKQPHASNICGAKTRAGTPCKNKAMPNGRCRMHGGKSTGVKRNKNAEKHGLFSKYIPKETMDLVDSIENLNTIDILWDNIKIQYAAIIRSQKIMYVKDRDDDDIHTIEETVIGKAPNKEDIKVNKIQAITAGERQSNFLQSQSRAMTTLSKMLRDYEELLKSDLATDIQRARLDKLKKDIGDNTDKPIAIRLITKGDADGAD